MLPGIGKIPEDEEVGEISWTEFEEPGETEPGYFRSLWEGIRSWFHQSVVARSFLSAVKAGRTNEVLQLLSEHPHLLAHHKFVIEGDSVWHLLAEFGDTGQIQLLINFVKIHDNSKAFEPAFGGKLFGRDSHRESHSQASDSSCSSGANRCAEEQNCPRRDYHPQVKQLVNLLNGLDQTPLMFAAYHGREEVMILLLENGADPWIIDRCGGRNALHYVCMKDHPQCVRVLIEYIDPCDRVINGTRYVNSRSVSGCSALHFALAANSVPCVVALLAYNAHLDVVNGYEGEEFWINCAKESTPLHVAALIGAVDCVKAILQYYILKKDALDLIDPRVWLDVRMRTPQMVALEEGFYEMSDVLDPRLDPASVAGAEIAAFCNYGNVPQLKALAAAVIKNGLEANLRESEEFMKLLGTYQNHGRLFARVAYTQGSDHISITADDDYNLAQQARTRMKGARLQPESRSTVGMSRMAFTTTSFNTTSFNRPSPSPREDMILNPELSASHRITLNPFDRGSPRYVDRQTSSGRHSEIGNFDSTGGRHSVFSPEGVPRAKDSPMSWLGYQRPRPALLPGSGSMAHTEANSSVSGDTSIDPRLSVKPSIPDKRQGYWGGFIFNNKANPKIQTLNLVPDPPNTCVNTPSRRHSVKPSKPEAQQEHSDKPSKSEAQQGYWRNWLGYGEGSIFNNKANPKIQTLHLVPVPPNTCVNTPSRRHSVKPSKPEAQQAYWRNWLGYGEGFVFKNKGPQVQARVVHLQNGRSRLSEAAKIGAVSWYQGLLGALGMGRNVYLPPQIGEDICDDSMLTSAVSSVCQETVLPTGPP
eukprot:gene21040-27910_t